MIGRARKSSAIPAAGGVARPSAPGASKKSYSNTALLPGARRRNNDCCTLLQGVCPPETVEAYLRGLADSDRSLLRQLQELLDLFRAYRPQQVAAALQKALAARAFGADYVAHLLHQIESPRPPQPPLQLRDPELNQLTTDPLSLLDYDALILKARKESADDPARETEPTSPDHHGPKTGDDDPGSGHQNLSFAAALERLADWELEARHGHAIERRFKLSRLPAQPTLDQFQFTHHKSRQQVKNRLLHLLDLDFLQQGTNVVIIGNPDAAIL